MPGFWRQEIALLLLGIFCACVYGMNVDFSRLRQIRKPFILNKRNDECSSNPCTPDKPFLCKSSTPTCIPLEYICDHNLNCPDGFDENPSLCNARNKPSVEEVEDFLRRNEKWIIPKLFSGADPELVAHSLVVSNDLEEIKMMIGIDPDSEQNLHDAFTAVMEGDERPLLKMGMPEQEWYDVQYVLNRLLDGGLEVFPDRYKRTND